ncbi:MAG TPA: four-carbon acid sugar kinase family protein, partial [Sphingomonas sp.]
MSDLLYAWIGDDFTGSTDALECLAEGGVPAVLFLRPPTRDMLGAFPDARAIGLALDARSRPPEWMDAHLPAMIDGLRAFDVPVLHYKTCSTFDSAPHRGSIGRAVELGLAAMGGPAPILVGAPDLRRYLIFGTLFAAAGAEVFRIDRHPTMAHHPATPMHEADLRRH